MDDTVRFVRPARQPRLGLATSQMELIVGLRQSNSQFSRVVNA
jgi:hypothetical protein